jgi:YVTN family beta-propeller protein
VSTIDVATRTKNPTDIGVGPEPVGVAVTPDGKTAFVTNDLGASVSTIDVATRGENPTDIAVGPGPFGLAITPDGTTVFVANFGGTTVSAIDVATKSRTDITVGSNPFGVAIAPCRTLPSRIFGVDAIGTAIAVSQAEFPNGGSASAVVLARSDFFSDALAGGPLAANVDGPLLITPGTPMSASLDARVQTEIQRILPTGKTVYILGGPLAISPTIDSTLVRLGYQVVRDPGTNEYATAVAIANQLGNPSTIFEATGLNFPDALSAVPAAIHAHGAILLTNGTTQAPETLIYLAAHPPTTRYAIGGPSAAAGADPSATAVFGPDLFGTSAAVATTFFPQTTVYGVATGLNFPDALAGGVYMATGGRLGPVLLVNTNAPLPAPISAYLATLAIGTPGYVFGGPLAVSDAVLATVQAAVG